MRSKLLFTILAILVFGSLFYCGYTFKETNFSKFLLIEGTTILAVFLFIFLYRKLIKPYIILTDSMDLLKAQDFSSRLRPIAHSEANAIIDVFNKMMDQLKNERLSVREKNQFLDLIIQASPQGLILLNFDYQITAINPAAQKILEIKEVDDVLLKKLNDLNTDMCHSLAQLEINDEQIIRPGGISQYRCSMSSFIDRGFSHPFILIEELTHELLLAEKKSYEGIIRMIAHEVNNSMGAVSSTLNVVSSIAQQNESLADVASAISASDERCRHLSKFISNFSEVVKIPEPSLSQTDINELVRSVSTLTYAECQRRQIQLQLNLSTDKCIVYIDNIQFEQALVNIVKNAYEAIEEGGIIRIKTQSKPLSIHIENNGPELTEEEKQKLFTPFFTTKSEGQGIGLMFIREVLSNHNSSFQFTSANGWTKFDIYLK